MWYNILLTILGFAENFLLALNSKFFQKDNIWGTRITQFITTIFGLTVIEYVGQGKMTWLWKIIYALFVMESDVLVIRLNKYMDSLAKKCNKKYKKIKKRKRT